jgi:gamma-glutamylcyclotransferase (GGCT)/AIG2-like uncharacterized protein YtfP
LYHAVVVTHLFVYGTLRSPFHNPYAWMLRRHSVLLGGARVRGRLYDMGRYPALRPTQGHDDWVTGEIYRLRNPAPLLAKLDTYEGPAYPRVRTQAVLDDGRPLTAWVYQHRRTLPDWRRVPSGEYVSSR